MDAFTVLTGIAAPFPVANVDTDLILPAAFVKTISRSGLGAGLFHNLRYLPDGAENPDFVLNKADYRRASILISGTNFGTGSSREHAPWALAEFGIRCVISPLFADIFATNCINSGVLPITLPQPAVDHLMEGASRPGGAMLTVDLPLQKIVRSDGDAIEFAIDSFAKHRLLNGLDDLEFTLKEQPAIDAFVARRRHLLPWL
jgi:3-isopropylmalate/(R)-2-methylmalate dehydratase small subunit